MAAAAGPTRASARGTPCKIARCAANMAANGRKVLGRDGAASPGDQGGAWQSQGRNLTALGADGAPTTRENLALRAPWHLCFKINPAIRQISPSSARSYFGRLYSLSGSDVMRSGTFRAIQGWSHPILTLTCDIWFYQLSKTFCRWPSSSASRASRTLDGGGMLTGVRGLL